MTLRLKTKLGQEGGKIGGTESLLTFLSTSLEQLLLDFLLHETLLKIRFLGGCYRLNYKMR